jgi:hypothetical protein
VVDVNQRGAAFLVFIALLSLLPVVDAGNLIAPPGRFPDNSFFGYISPGETSRAFMRCDQGDIFYGEMALEGGGVVDFFICDSDNYDLWQASQEATLYELAESVDSCTWRFQVPHDALWMAVFVNNATSFTVRISASYYKVSPGQILATNGLLSLEAGSAVLIALGAVLLYRRQRSQSSSSRIELDTEQTAHPGRYLELFRTATALTLLVQCCSITLVVLLEISSRWDPSVSTNGFNILLLFYLIPLILPLLLANELFKRRQCKTLLTLWSIGAAAFGHYFLWAYYIGGGMTLLGWALSYIVPSWIPLAFVMAEAISLSSPAPSQKEQGII